MSTELYHIPEQTDTLRLSGSKESCVVDSYELRRDDILVELYTQHGDGIYSDDPEEEDIQFIRFTVWQKIGDDSGWDPVPGANYCTMIQDTIPESEWHSMAEHILDKLHPVLHDGGSNGVDIKKWCRKLGWNTDSGAIFARETYEW